MRRLPLRNSPAHLVADGDVLLVEAPGQGPYPVAMGVLSLTSRCTLACVMCLEPRDPGPADLPFDRARELVDLFAGRVATIWSCAGEALSYPRFFDLAQVVTERGTRLGVGTNGLPFAEAEVVARAAAAGVGCCHISCHTSRKERFAALTGASERRRFEEHRRGLENVDAWNRDHPERPLEVLLQLVLMRPFADELDEYLDFVAAHLAHSPLVIRVEPMLPMNAARAHPELHLDLDEVGTIVRRLLAAAAERFTFELKGIPLCLLEGVEGLSEDLRTRAAGTVVVGNLGRHSADLQLQCPVGDPAQSAFAARCAACPLVALCPGVMENPVPAGSPWPRVAREAPEALLARLGLRGDYARRRFSLEYPRHATGPNPDVGPAWTAGAAAAAGAPPPGLAPEHVGVDPAAPQRFTVAQAARVEGAVRALERARAVTARYVTGRFAAVALPAADGAAPAVVVFEPALPATPAYFTSGGIAVRYNGTLTPGLRADLARVRRLLAMPGPP